MEDFTSAKVGDIVILANGFNERIATITRITKTCVEANGFLFKKEDGMAYRNSRYYFGIEHATPQRIKEIKDKWYRSKLDEKILKELSYDTIGKLSIDQLEAIWKILGLDVKQLQEEYKLPVVPYFLS